VPFYLVSAFSWLWVVRRGTHIEVCWKFAGQDLRPRLDTRGGSEAASASQSASHQAPPKIVVGDESRTTPSKVPAPSAAAPAHHPDSSAQSAQQELQATPTSPPKSLLGGEDADASVHAAETTSESHPAGREPGGRAQESPGERRRNTLVRQKTADHPLDQQSLGVADRSPGSEGAGSAGSEGEAAAGGSGSRAGSSHREAKESPEGVGLESSEGLDRGKGGEHGGWITGMDSETVTAATSRGRGEEGDGMSDARAALVLESAFSGMLMQPGGWESEVPIHVPEDPAELLARGKSQAGASVAKAGPAESPSRQAAEAVPDTQLGTAERQVSGGEQW